MEWQGALIVAVLAVAGGLLVGALAARALGSLLARLAPDRTASLRQRLRAPCLFVAPLLLLKIADADATWALGRAGLAAHVQYLGTVISVARLLGVAELLIVERLTGSQRTGPGLRKVHTQISLMRKILSALLAIVVLALALMSFTGIRQLGTSLLASAGVAGIIIGIAAQRSLGNVVAGLSILFTETLRIGDAVVVEGEWGIVEDLTLTYVVVKVWDLRCLILPLTYFVEKPFQNWTHASSNLLGTVIWWVDFDADVEALRQSFIDLVHAHPKWDQKTAALQVTEVSETAVQLRGLVSAADAGALFDLRCDLRERMLARIRATGEGAWPRRRWLDLDGQPAQGSPNGTR
jgi:small-conductance mechanosensitive channel